MADYYLGLDQGTTGTTSLLMNSSWNVAARGYREQTQYYPAPGWVEQDPEELWQCLLDVTAQVIKAAGIVLSDIRCLGIANQGETVLLWDRETGIPVYPAIVWQDRRTAGMADQLSEQYGDWIRERTGLIPDAYFSATKISWILDQVEGAREKADAGKLLAGTLDSWLIWKLTGGRLHMTDLSTASRTMLLNLHTGSWDPELLDLFRIPPGILPEIRSSAEIYGRTDSEVFGASVLISGSAVDQQAALFGQACLRPGSVKTTYGTGCFMLMNTGSRLVRSERGLLSTVGWKICGETVYALDGGIYIAGAAVQWLRDKLRIISSASDTEAMAESVPDTGGVYFVPAFAGLAAPYWDPYARGTIVGITGGTTREELVRAALESIAYQVKDNLKLMEQDSGIRVDVMRADGGIAENRFLMQFQADILDIPVDVPEITETTALGAARLAACGLGDFRDKKELEAGWRRKERFEPRMGPVEREQLLYQWHRAVERARGWIEA